MITADPVGVTISSVLAIGIVAVGCVAGQLAADAGAARRRGLLAVLVGAVGLLAALVVAPLLSSVGADALGDVLLRALVTVVAGSASVLALLVGVGLLLGVASQRSATATPEQH